MSTSLIFKDTEVLPAELLPIVKQHCRVEFTRDDEYLKLATARAIAEIENQANRSIAPAEYLWTPVCGGCHFVQPPYGPIRSISNKGEPGEWVELPWQDAYECGRLRCDWVLANVGTGFKLAVGHASADTVPPDVLSAVLLLTAALYENRESMQFGTLNHLPDHVNRLMAGLWRPSV